MGLQRAGGGSGASILKGVVREELWEGTIWAKPQRRDIIKEMQERNDGSLLEKWSEILEMFW